jgi:hypothetical protein
VGLAIFPADLSCGAPVGLTSPFAPTPSLEAVNLHLPAGGTPTAAALRFALERPELADASMDRVVVLITDGLPNCNEQHPGNSCNGRGTCHCTASSCASLCSVGCLDDDATLAAAQALGSSGIQLITVTVGEEWASPDGTALSRALGEVAVSSPACGAPCRALVLQLGQGLTDAVTERLGKRLAGCTFSLPSAVASLQVELAGRPLAASEFSQQGALVWLGAEACRQYREGQAVAFFAP